MYYVERERKRESTYVYVCTCTGMFMSQHKWKSEGKLQATAGSLLSYRFLRLELGLLGLVVCSFTTNPSHQPYPILYTHSAPPWCFF